MDTTNEPVAWLVQYRDRHEFRWKKPEHLYEALACEPLYTHPNQHDLGIAEAIGFDKGYQAAATKTPTDDFIYKNHMGYVSPAGAFYAPDYPTWKQDGFTPVYREPTVEELTDEEILCLWDWWSGEILSTDILDFADTYRRALLGEAGLVKWHQAYVKKMNEQDPARKATQE
jgi:hypothetical protein